MLELNNAEISLWRSESLAVELRENLLRACRSFGGADDDAAAGLFIGADSAVSIALPALAG